MNGQSIEESPSRFTNKDSCELTRTYDAILKLRSRYPYCNV